MADTSERANVMPAERLRTERLDLVALTPELARLALNDREELGRRLGACVPSVWPGAAFARMLPYLANGFEERSDPSPPLPTRLVVHREDAVLVGETGFHGPPDPTGTVEIGYSVVPDYRGRGIALEATRLLLRDAILRARVRRIVAECEPDNVASIRVLEALGLRRRERVGKRYRYELRVGGTPSFA
jgi:RimJ/RimL family protein N-acetyltransferase